MSMRLKYACVQGGQYGANISGSDYTDTGVRFIRTTDIRPDGTLTQSDEGVFVPASLVRDYMLRPGDLLFSRSGTLGRAYLHESRTRDDRNGYAFAGYLVRFRPKRSVSPRFLFYTSRSTDFLDQIEADAIQTTISNFNAEKYGNIAVELPPLDKQRAIAACLDRETARIDALIEKKRRQIKLLHEKRAALSSHAVTKGLDPKATMKESGIPGLGRVPLSWTFKRLKYLAQEITVGVVITPSIYYVDEGIPFLRSLNIKEDEIVSSDMVFLSKESNLQLHKSRLNAGDLVSVRTGQPGTTAVIDERFEGTNCIDLIITRCSDEFDSRFMCYAMNSAFSKSQYAAGSSGAIQAHFNVETAGNMLIPAPPLVTQIAIREYLDETTMKLGMLMAKINASIDRLREYRTALISAGVTGKIDVLQTVARQHKDAEA